MSYNNNRGYSSRGGSGSGGYHTSGYRSGGGQHGTPRPNYNSQPGQQQYIPYSERGPQSHSSNWPPGATLVTVSFSFRSASTPPQCIWHSSFISSPMPFCPNGPLLLVSFQQVSNINANANGLTAVRFYVNRANSASNKASIEVLDSWREGTNLFILVKTPVQAQELTRLSGIKFDGAVTTVRLANQPGMQPPSRPQSAPAGSGQKADVAQRLTECIERRYDSATQTLDLSDWRSEPFLRTIGPLRQEVLDTIRAHMWGIITKHNVAIRGISLANNRLGNLSEWGEFLCKFPGLVSLDLSKNNLTGFASFDPSTRPHTLCWRRSTAAIIPSFHTPMPSASRMCARCATVFQPSACSTAKSSCSWLLLPKRMCFRPCWRRHSIRPMCAIRRCSSFCKHSCRRLMAIGTYSCPYTTQTPSFQLLPLARSVATI
ncbi:hypothetical protein BCR44DRAFT_1241197 [Catenaria anguillulae PL171]|uniref:Uncharacterized protein n=1 Tax=Catenaria anguillulae PL171 TaxID=765915 RepID=A0A1Y2HE70_9FUNG|nr:hypothetical protein BCR44DRAFT_1241197 [Catenaria anguillulae PL171]